MEPKMLQHLINAYAEAYTVAISPSIIRANDRQPREPVSDSEAPGRKSGSGGWRTLLSAFL
jgi:hypothetical protein